MSKLQIFVGIFAVHKIIFSYNYFKCIFFFNLFWNSLLNWFKWTDARSNQRIRKYFLLTKNSTCWHDLWLCKDKDLSIDGYYGIWNDLWKSSSDSLNHFNVLVNDKYNQKWSYKCTFHAYILSDKLHAFRSWK